MKSFFVEEEKEEDFLGEQLFRWRVDMPKKDYSWIDEYLERMVGTADRNYLIEIIKKCRVELERLTEENAKLKRQVGYYKYGRKRKAEG